MGKRLLIVSIFMLSILSASFSVAQQSGAQRRTQVEIPQEAKDAYQDGLNKANQKQFDNAIESMKKAVELCAEFGMAHYMLGKLYLVKEDCDKAILYSKKALDLAGPKDKRWADEARNTLMFATLQQEAEAANDAVSQMRLACTYEYNFMYEESTKAFNKAKSMSEGITYSDERNEALKEYERADKLMERGDYESALTLIQRIIEINPNRDYYDKSFMGPGFFKKGECLYKLGDMQKAVEAYAEVTKNYYYENVDGYFDDNIWGSAAYLRLGQIAKEAQEYPKAFKNFVKAVDADLEMGVWAKEALEEYSKLFMEQPTASDNVDTDSLFFYKAGVKHLNNGFHEIAVIDFAKATSVKKEYPDAYHGLGMAYMKKKDFDAGINVLSTAIKQKPDFAKAYATLAECYEEKRMWSQAEMTWTKAIEFSPNSNEFKQGLKLTQMAMLLLNKLQSQPQDDESHIKLGQLYKHKKWYEDAITELKTASELNPLSNSAWGNLADAYEAAEQWNEAIQAWQKREELDPLSQAGKYARRKIEYCVMRRSKGSEIRDKKEYEEVEEARKIWEEATKPYDDVSKYKMSNAKYWQIINRWPKSNLAYDAAYQIGYNCQIFLKDYGEAINAFKFLLENYPMCKWGLESQYRLALCYALFKKYEDAREEYQKVLDYYQNARPPTSSCDYPNLATICMFDIATTYVNEGRYEEARQQLKKILRIAEGKTVMPIAYPMQLEYLRCDLPAEMAPKDAGAPGGGRSVKGWIGAPGINYSLASECLFRIGQTYENEGDYDNAKRAYITIANWNEKSNPSIAGTAHYMICLIYEEKDRNIDKAIREYFRIVHKVPGYSPGGGTAYRWYTNYGVSGWWHWHACRAEYTLGDLFKKKGQKGLAISAYRRSIEEALKVAKGYPGQLGGLAYIQIGKILEDYLTNRSKAKDAYEYAAEEFKKEYEGKRDYTALLAVADVYNYHLGSKMKAKPFYQQIRSEIDPEQSPQFRNIREIAIGELGIKE